MWMQRAEDIKDGARNENDGFSGRRSFRLLRKCANRCRRRRRRKCQGCQCRRHRRQRRRHNHGAKNGGKGRASVGGGIFPANGRKNQGQILLAVNIRKIQCGTVKATDSTQGSNGQTVEFRPALHKFRKHRRKFRAANHARRWCRWCRWRRWRRWRRCGVSSSRGRRCHFSFFFLFAQDPLSLVKSKKK